MAREFTLVPKCVPRLETALRRIATDLPVPESLPVLESLHRLEPQAMRCQPPVVWHHADGFQVSDAWGNLWIDWSGGAPGSSAGHGRKEISKAIAREMKLPLFASAGFPTQARAKLIEKLASLLPEPLKKVALFTTGSETVECAIKLCRSFGVRAGGRRKHVIVTFENAFHGRTLGAQLAGGIPQLKEWIVNVDAGFAQIPFPDGYRTRDSSFEGFERSLRTAGIDSQNVAGVMLESCQSGTGAFAPPAYMTALRQWCTGHKALLVCDEVQSGFGRTGKFFAFEHYGIVPDLALFGAGLSSALPLSAVAGRVDVMDLPQPGTMSSSHAGNPICCAAALAEIDVLLHDRLTENARAVGTVLHSLLHSLASRFPRIAHVSGKGLMASLACVAQGSTTPDGDLAFDVVLRAMEKGVLMSAPVGPGSATLRIAPPLSITEDAVRESVSALEEAFAEVLTVQPAVPA